MAKKFAKLREQLTETCGKGKFKILKDDSVHVYGIIPGTGMLGFWFLGWADELEGNERLVNHLTRED